MKKFDFKKQLSAGASGEKDFQDFYSYLNPKKSEDLKYDFIIDDGDTVEVKTDTYPMEKTPNFFMEYFSDTKSGKLGGPWRAKKDNVKYFVYYFVKDKTFFWFETKLLIEALDDYLAVHTPQVKNIPNKGWITQGFAIPRKALEVVLLKKEIVK